MAKVRKGLHYVPCIDVLLRDAMPTPKDIEGEPDACKRQERARARDAARIELARIARDEKTFAQLSLPYRLEVRWLVDALAQQQRRLLVGERKRFPTQRDGRPRDDHRRLLIAVTMRELDKKGMSRASAIEHVAARFKIAKRRADEIYSGSDLVAAERDRWEYWIRVELARRAYDAWTIEALVVAAALSLPG